MTKEEANKLLAEKLAQAAKLISECEALADEHGLQFYSPIDEYGMGGVYLGAGKKSEDDEFENSDWESSDSTGWQPSSQSC